MGDAQEKKHTKNVIISKWCDEKKDIISNNSDEVKAAKPTLADIQKKCFLDRRDNDGLLGEVRCKPSGGIA